MSLEANKGLVGRFFEAVWNRGDLAAVDEFVDPDFVNFGVRRGTEGMRPIVSLWRTAFPDLRLVIDDMVAEDDQVTCRMTACGTHVGEFRHPTMGTLAPTGRSFSVDQCHVVRIGGGRITEHWATRDDLGMLQQLGVVAAAADDTRTMMGLITGSWVAQAVFAAARLGVADHLAAAGPQTAAELAARTGAHADAVHRLLRALASAGVFAEDADARFGLTPLAEVLRSDHPQSARPFAIMMGEQWAWRSWGEIMHSMHTGEPGFPRVFGTGVFDYYAGHPDAARVGAAGLSGRSAAENDAVVRAFDFAGVASVTDVGGGEGSLLRAVLAANPHLHGVLFEMPHVVELARDALAGVPEADRLRFVAGDFLADVSGVPGSLVMLKKVLHDWSDDQASTILRHCRAAMSPGGRLLLIENVVPAGNGPSFAKWLDLLMLVFAGGRERAVEQFSQLLAATGFDLVRVVPTAAGISVVEAVAS